MPELLFELGCEELPASFVRKAYRDLELEIVRRLDAESVPHGASRSLGTPRRLIVVVEDVAELQPDRTKEVRGPAIKAAYDSDRNPTKALLGFCKGQGVDVSELRDDGEYVWATIRIEGKPMQSLLAELLPDAVKSLSFEKSMRWGSNRMRFARPIRWLLALFDEKVVEFSIEGIPSGNFTHGHRFDGEQNIEVKNFSNLIDGLKSRGNVIADPDDRESIIRESSRKIASGEPEMPDALVEENVFLTEWPIAITGRFKDEFLDLPEPVLVTAMAIHEKFFPVRNSDSRLTNEFVSIRNAGVDDVVRQGNAWVLNARFNDAKFFYDEDRKKTLEDFLEKTSGVIFQEKLGSVRERANRLSSLASTVAATVGYDATTQELCARAGLLAKADLSSGLVSELASLQGVIGGEYARAQGEALEVCAAISNQYDVYSALALRGRERSVAVCLCAADQIDKLTGYIGLGLTPTGSSDPFALRRAASVLIEIAMQCDEFTVGYGGLFERAKDLFIAQGQDFDSLALTQSLGDIFEGRYAVWFSEVRHDIRDSAIAPMPNFGIDDRLNPRSVAAKITSLEQLADHPLVVQCATRPINILNAAIEKKQYKIGTHFDTTKLDSSLGLQLLQAVEIAEVNDNLVEAIMSLNAPINEFFDGTMIMAEDPLVRTARLALVERVCNLLLRAGNFATLVVEYS